MERLVVGLDQSVSIVFGGRYSGSRVDSQIDKTNILNLNISWYVVNRHAGGGNRSLFKIRTYTDNLRTTMSKKIICARCHKPIKNNPKPFGKKQYHPLCKEAVLNER